MDEQAKMLLYKQLMKFEVMSKMKTVDLITWEEYSKLDNKEALEYASDYRDICSEEFNRRARKSERRPLYLELPEMDLEGENLSDFYLHDFMPGYAKERANGKKVFITTKINLKDTKCVINMGTIRPIIISLDGKTIREITADIRKCDFRGCTVFGKFQNSKAKLEYTENNLPLEYIERLINYKVPEEAILTTDNVYIDMIEGNLVRGTNGLEKVKQMVDYNLTPLKERIWNYRTVIRDYKIDISYTGVFIYQYGMESIGQENYYIDLEGRAKEAYLKNDMDYVESVYRELDKDTQRQLVSLALKDGKEQFVRRHKRDLRGVQKKYFNAKDSRMQITNENVKIKDHIRKEYKDGKLVEFGIDLMKIDIDTRSELLSEIYAQGNLELVQKYLSVMTSKLRNEILVAEYKKGNIDYVYKNFGQIDNGDLKETILDKEIKDKNFEFLYQNYNYIYNKDIRDKILKHAFKQENVDFLNQHLEDMSHNMKLEAAIKFKDLKLSKVELAMLLKK